MTGDAASFGGEHLRFDWSGDRERSKSLEDVPQRISLASPRPGPFAADSGRPAAEVKQRGRSDSRTWRLAANRLPSADMSCAFQAAWNAAGASSGLLISIARSLFLAGCRKHPQRRFDGGLRIAVVEDRERNGQAAEGV